MHPRTTTVTKLVHDHHGGHARVVVITLPWSPGFGDDAKEKGAGGEPAPVESRLRRWGPRHAFERD